jgi:hypothetical protein
LFRKFKSVTSAFIRNNKFGFHSIPVGEPAKLVAFYKNNEKYFLSIQDIVISDNLEINPKFKEVTLVELEKKMESISWAEDI